MFPSPCSQQRRPASVLVVDDESGVRNILADWLRGAGYACQRAGGAKQAWDILETCDIDLMTLDITLPGTSGLEFLPKVKEVFEDTEVIMMTALADTRIAVEALSAGASGYVTKPFEREEVLFQVGRALERRALLRDNRLYTHGLEQCIHEQTCEIRRAHEETIPGSWRHHATATKKPEHISGESGCTASY